MDDIIAREFRDVQREIKHIRIIIKKIRDDFMVHTQKDEEELERIKRQITTWSSQLVIIKWLSCAILTALIATIIKRW